MTEQLTHKTTKAHYEKYSQLASKLHVKLTEDSLHLFDLYNVHDLRNHYKQDSNLNNIPLRYFDAIYVGLGMRRHYRLSLAENTCLYKHCLIYQVLQAKPEFTD